ncbi:hypothetical protein BGZ60DRAFT_424566 [Tricladium varicosporioides]|nr:hypothetical protein BGZ60DRAFT_424566 [Hymenoscyphus varicosporioides]
MIGWQGTSPAWLWLVPGFLLEECIEGQFDGHFQARSSINLINPPPDPLPATSFIFDEAILDNNGSTSRDARSHR